MDGARVLNASVVSGTAVADYALMHDSTPGLRLTKVSGVQSGRVLAGSRDCREAWHFKRMFGGAMRQTGVLTAMCLYALDHHVERLAEDHARASGSRPRLRGVRCLRACFPWKQTLCWPKYRLLPSFPAAELRDFSRRKTSRSWLSVVIVFG